MAEPILDVRDLTVTFDTDDGTVHAVDGVSYTVGAGETLGIVGESGSGKSVSSLTVMGLTRSSNAHITGEVHFGGRDLLKLSDEAIRGIRGSEIAMIFQDPLSSLHPFYRVGFQLAEAVRAHHKVSKGAALDRAVELLGRVGIPEPRKRADAYPHEFSGGMRQRAMIAMALINDPKLLIADEPTTALDVTVQAQILELMERLQEEFETALVFITHDLGVVAEVADQIAVMYAGQIIEHADTRTLFAAPEHPTPGGCCGRSRGSTPRRRRARAGRGPPAVAHPPPERLPLPSALPLRPRPPPARGADARAVGRRPRGRLPAAGRDAPAAVEAPRSGHRTRRRRAAPSSRRASHEHGRRAGDRRGGRPPPAGRGARRGARPRQALPADARGDLPQAGRRGEGGRRRVVRRHARRDARARRRVGLRQVDDGAAARAAARADERVDPLRGQGAHRISPVPSSRPCGATCR